MVLILKQRFCSKDNLLLYCIVLYHKKRNTDIHLRSRDRVVGKTFCMKTDLSKFDNSWYQPGSAMKRLLWYLISAIFFKSWFPEKRSKIYLLRLFGAKIGAGVVIKPHVNIKYPWNLIIGNHVWIGEDVWIDNLDLVTIDDHACISQGALLLCGNHDYKKATFDLIIGPIHIQEGGWVGAKAIVTQHVVVASHSMIGAGSVVNKSTEPYMIYAGNPAVKVRERKIKE